MESSLENNPMIVREPKMSLYGRSQPGLFRMTVEKFEACIAAGAIGEEDAVELLDGLIVDKMSINPPHAYLTKVLYDLVFKAISDKPIIVNSQAPFTLSETSRPEPDLYIAKGELIDYRTKLPTASDLLWVAEVADSSIEADRGKKLELYAAAGILEYWIVDINTARIECYTGPNTDGSYGSKSTFARGQTIVHDLLGEVEVGELFGEEHE